MSSSDLKYFPQTLDFGTPANAEHPDAVAAHEEMAQRNGAFLVEQVRLTVPLAAEAHIWVNRGLTCD